MSHASPTGRSLNGFCCRTVGPRSRKTTKGTALRNAACQSPNRDRTQGRIEKALAENQGGGKKRRASAPERSSLSKTTNTGVQRKAREVESASTRPGGKRTKRRNFYGWDNEPLTKGKTGPISTRNQGEGESPIARKEKKSPTEMTPGGGNKNHTGQAEKVEKAPRLEDYLSTKEAARPNGCKKRKIEKKLFLRKNSQKAGNAQAEKSLGRPTNHLMAGHLRDHGGLGGGFAPGRETTANKKKGAI